MLTPADVCFISLARRDPPRNNFKRLSLRGPLFFGIMFVCFALFGTFGPAFSPPCRRPINPPSPSRLVRDCNISLPTILQPGHHPHSKPH